jgi:hypothetical protein
MLLLQRVTSSAPSAAWGLDDNAEHVHPGLQRVVNGRRRGPLEGERGGAAGGGLLARRSVVIGVDSSISSDARHAFRHDAIHSRSTWASSSAVSRAA